MSWCGAEFKLEEWTAGALSEATTKEGVSFSLGTAKLKVHLNDNGVNGTAFQSSSPLIPPCSP